MGTAKEQLEADFEAAFKTFFPRGGLPPTDFKVFCLGVTMCAHTFKGYAEDPKTWPDDAADVEEAAQAYYDAARKTIHAD